MREKQGLSEDKWYEAIVIENDDRKHPDKMMLGRIQARISVLFDGIADKDLPWAIPVWDHPDGACELSGTFSVPKKKTKVFLRFQQANPAFPMYRGYHVDKVTQMEEVKYNYPDRTVTRFSNKALLIVDTADNVLYLRNPGDVKIYVEGNVELEVKGDVDELVRGSYRRTIMGNLYDTVLGKREIYTKGEKVESTLGNVHEYSTGRKTVESNGEVHMEASNVYMNSARALGPPPPILFAKMGKWPGVPGGAKGSNVRPNIKSKNATTRNADTSPVKATTKVEPLKTEHSARNEYPPQEPIP